MTFFIRSRLPRRRRSGFTLVELLVVIGIILILMAIILPSVNKAYKVATRTRMEFDMQAISTALEAYRADFDQYPQVYDNRGGAFWLCTALVGPGDHTVDGHDGLGFSVRQGGKVWGPYLPNDKIKMGQPGVTGTGDPNKYVLLDRYKHPILYFPAKKGPAIDIHQPGGFMGTGGMFNPNDNTSSGDPTAGQMTTTMFQVLMGDVNQNGQIDAGESPAFNGNYVLWSAGPDEKFGPDDPTQPVSPRNRCDDVANFPRSEY